MTTVGKRSCVTLFVSWFKVPIEVPKKPASCHIEKQKQVGKDVTHEYSKGIKYKHKSPSKKARDRNRRKLWKRKQTAGGSKQHETDKQSELPCDTETHVVDEPATEANPCRQQAPDSDCEPTKAVCPTCKVKT